MCERRKAQVAKKQRFRRNPTFSALTRKAWLHALKRLRAFAPSRVSQGVSSCLGSVA